MLRNVLEAVRGQRCDHMPEVSVIDSGSTDDSLVIASQFGARIETIPPAEFDHGLTRNRAIEGSSGDIVILLSQDAVPGDPDWLNNIVRAFDDPLVAGAYCRQVPRADADILTKRDAPNLLAGRTSPYVRWIQDWDAYHRLSPLERYHFCNFDDVCSAIRKTVWRRIPFRASDFGEDIDWGQRVLEAGWKIAYCPEAYVVHSHRPSYKYLYARHHATIKKLYRQFGVCTVPGRRALVRQTVLSTLRDWFYMLRHERSISALLRAIVQVPLHTFASIYGQYRGAIDAEAERD